MAETVLNSRIKLRCDTYTNWATTDPVLYSGEIAVVVLSKGGTDDDLNDVTDTILFKIGDGASKFSELGWTSSLAADVYEWAKAETKPAYKYSEITNTPIVEADLSGLTEVASNRLYCHTGTTTTNFVQGHLYNYANNKWIDLLQVGTTLDTLVGSHRINELGDLAWSDGDSLLDVYTVTSDELTTVQALRTLYEQHISDGKHYIYDLSAFDASQGLKSCAISFSDSKSNKFFYVRDLQSGKEFSDSVGYAYRSDYPLSDYFNGMNVGYPFKVVKVTRTDLTFSFIEGALSQINSTTGDIFFDLSALLDRAYFCTISIDSTNKIARVQDLINGKYAKITFTDSTLLTDILPYVECPIKVYTELPTSGDYIGDICLVKNYGWSDLSSDSDLVVGKTYQLKIPANTGCFQYSSMGHYVEVLNMTVKTSGKAAQTYSYTSDYDDIIHTGSFVTKDAFYIVTSINTTDRTFVGYDFTSSTGSTEFLATGIYNSKNTTVAGSFLNFLAAQTENYSSPKIWNGLIWSDIASKANITELQDLILHVVDLSLYSKGDVISDTLAETLKQYKSNIKYDGVELEYIKLSDETTWGYSEALTYDGVKFVDDHPYLMAMVIGKSTKDSKWYLAEYQTVKMATYSSDENKLHIYLDSNETFQIVNSDQTKTVDMKLNSSQSDQSITLALPSTNGTLALISDTELTASKISAVLGYTPYDGTTNPNGYITKDTSALTNYYTSTKVDELLANSGSSSNDVRTLIGSHELTALGAAAWMDEADIVTVVNNQYTPEVTTDTMNTAIDNKISAALAALEFNRYYTGTTSPSSDLGNDGDLYLQQ